ncbi:MAG: ABC transporter permease [Gemmiger sp.]|nr:ABC transporter permease [Gemmiger sp.]
MHGIGTALWAELKKAHHRHDLWVILASAGVIIGWVMAVECRHPTPEDLASFYAGLFYTYPLVNSIILPVAMAVLASRLWDVENKCDACKLLFTLQSPTALYTSKLVLGGLEVAAIAGLETLSVPVLGLLCHATQPLDGTQLAWLFFSAFGVSLMLFFLEFALSIGFANQVPALAIGLGGAFIGLFSAFFPAGLSVWLPWSYYNQLMTVGMDWNPTTREIHYYTNPYPVWPWLVLLVACLALGFVGRRLVERKEA